MPPIPRLIYPRLIALAILIALWIIGVFPLVDHYYLHTFEADASGTLDYTARFRSLLGWPDPRNLPALADYPPYLDGQYFVYAITTNLVYFLQYLGLIANATTPSEQSVIIFSIRHLHLLCHLTSAILLFLICLRLNRSSTVALCAGVFLLFSQQILNIDFLRIDHLILALFLFLIFLALAAQTTKNPLTVAFFFTCAAALLATTKITSVLLITPPACLFIANIRKRQQSLRTLLAPMFVSAIFACLLSVRYIIHPLAIVPNLLAKYHNVEKWNGMLSRHPFAYYVWDLFRANGISFPALAIFAGIVTVASLCFKSRRDPYVIFLASTFVAYGLLSVIVFKYARGGYHIVPIYILCVVNLFSLSESLERLRSCSWRSSLLFRHLLPALLLVTFLIESRPAYDRMRSGFVELATSIDITRTQPTEWLRRHFPSRTRIAIPVHSEWGLPPLADYGYRLDYDFLNFPYLDTGALADYSPPDVPTMLRAADVIVLNDWHTQIYINFMRQHGFLHLADKWVLFYNDDLPRFPTYRFVSTSPCYGISEVRIIVLNASLAIAPLPAADRRAPLVR